MSPKIKLDRHRITELCRKWNVVELALFGSVVREDFRPDSDIDVLVSFAPDARPTLFDILHMQDELSDILGREVDLVSRRGIEESHNPIKRRSILDSAEVVYAA